MLGVLVHGDAAFAGQGLVAETLNLSSLRGYRTGGTVHVIVNNQIGFTTVAGGVALDALLHRRREDDPGARSSTSTARIPRRWRRWCGWRWTTAASSSSDVVIDMYCYRKYGHNEGDEPSFTQPLLYQKIEQHPPVRRLYAKRAHRASGVIDAGRGRGDRRARSTRSSTRSSRGQALGAARGSALGAGVWHGYRGGPDTATPEVDDRRRRASVLAGDRRAASPTLPAGFHAAPEDRARCSSSARRWARGEQPLDWGMGELLAFGSLVRDGVAGAAVAARTRGAAPSATATRCIVDSEHRARVRAARARCTPSRALCRIYDSPLSEAGVLGFEFGYSLDYPDALVIVGGAVRRLRRTARR